MKIKIPGDWGGSSLRRADKATGNIKILIPLSSKGNLEGTIGALEYHVPIATPFPPTPTYPIQKVNTHY